jgi:hypothetical protein
LPGRAMPPGAYPSIHPIFSRFMSPFFALRPAVLGLFAVLGTPVAALAQAPQPPVQLTQPAAASLRLRFDNPTLRPARLQVLSLTTDNLLLSETHREPAYGVRLDFDTLPTGRYEVSLRLGPDRYRYTVQVQARPQGPALTIVESTITTHQVEPVLASAAH